MTQEPDNVARVIAIAAVLLSVTQMIIGSRRSLWRRRAANVGALRVTLEELRPVIDGASDARGAVNLWTQIMDARMEALLEQVAEVPDRRLNTLGHRIHGGLRSVRGMSTPSNDDMLNAGVNLNTEQKKILARASGDVAAALARISRCIRKGGRQV